MSKLTQELKADLLAGTVLFAALVSLDQPERFDQLLESNDALTPEQLNTLESVVGTGGLMAPATIHDFMTPLRKHGRISLRRLREAIDITFN